MSILGLDRDNTEHSFQDSDRFVWCTALVMTVPIAGTKNNPVTTALAVMLESGSRS